MSAGKPFRKPASQITTATKKQDAELARIMHEGLIG